MSTRATITVADQHDSFDIYQHNDGYPDGPFGLVRHIAMAQNLAWELPRFEAADFAAAIIAVLKDHGGSTYLTKEADAHSDRAFHYHVAPIWNNTLTRVNLTIWQSVWSGPDKQIFKGAISKAVQKFDAIPDKLSEPRELQMLGTIENSLWRASEEITALCGERSDPDTVKVFEEIESAGRDLMRLRLHLERENPWEALKLAAKGNTTWAALAHEAHLRFQR